MNEDRFFSSYVKLCREHPEPDFLNHQVRLERRHDPKTKRSMFRVVCPICKRETVWINNRRKAIATWNMIITLTSKR